jgi:hypothetical protein
MPTETIGRQRERHHDSRVRRTGAGGAVPVGRGARAAGHQASAGIKTRPDIYEETVLGFLDRTLKEEIPLVFTVAPFRDRGEVRLVCPKPAKVGDVDDLVSRGDPLGPQDHRPHGGTVHQPREQSLIHGYEQREIASSHG